MRLEKDALLTLLYAIGSIASIIGVFISVYVLRREVGISRDVEQLKSEEENWHNAKEKKQ